MNLRNFLHSGIAAHYMVYNFARIHKTAHQSRASSWNY
jgi:hypothetical protein